MTLRSDIEDRIIEGRILKWYRYVIYIIYDRFWPNFERSRRFENVENPDYGSNKPILGMSSLRSQLTDSQKCFYETEYNNTFMTNKVSKVWTRATCFHRNFWFL